MSARRDRQLAELRKKWGHAISRERAMDSVSTYHRWVGGDRQMVDEQTWQDLGMDDLFAKVDRTSGIPGQQILYDQMRTYVKEDETLAERARQHALFRTEAGLREKIQLLLTKLNQPGAQYLAPLILGELPLLPRFARLLYLLGILPALCLVGAAFFPLLFLAALLVILVNTFIYATYGQKILPYFAGFFEINTMLGVAEALGKIQDDHRVPQLEYLKASRPLLARLKKRLGWLVVDRTALPELAQALFGYLNMFFLFDVLVFMRSNSALRENQPALARIMESVGSLDASIAVASYLEELPSFCVPRVVDDRRMEVTALYHPLVPAAVSNPFHLVNRSALIAGPNMAGKTSFIRTVGLNVILAQTLNFCLAEQAVLPRARVRSSIRREDNLSEGQSYFFAEIKQILDFIRPEEADGLQFLLIDEVFRGTNTIERVASSVAVLRHLAQTQIVLATTHDLELQELLADSFDMFHFTDRVTDGKYGFDYRICAGAVRSRNAIKLLELSGYPKSIIDEAQQIAENFAAKPARGNQPLREF